MGTESTDVRKRLLHKASMNKTLAARVVAAVRNDASPRLLTAAQRLDLQDVIRIVRGAEAPVSLTKMPGFAPMQLRAKIARLAEVRQELIALQAEFEQAFKKAETLESEEKEGLALLKNAASEMGKKGKFVADAEKALLEFTAYEKAQVPGIEQMIAKADDPEVLKKGLKAGDLFGRIAAELGEQVAASVETIYIACKTDLTHTAMAIKALKVVSKTSSIDHEILKRAGVLEVFQSVRSWLSGAKESIVQRVFGIIDNIKTWAKGFTDRTKDVDKASGDLEKALASAMSATDKLMAQVAKA